MTNAKREKIKDIISGVAYGSIDQQLSQKEKLIYGFGGLIIAVTAQVALADWLINNNAPAQVLLISNLALLNIIVFPFQLVGLISLIYVVQGVTKYPFGMYSFWDFKKEKYIPFFIRARTFMYQPYLIVFIISNYIGVYMDYKTEHPHFYFWFIYHNILIFLGVIVAIWLRTLLNKFENAIISIKYLLPDESIFKNYVNSVKSNVFNRKEIIFILIVFLLVKVNDVISIQTWKGG